MSQPTPQKPRSIRAIRRLRKKAPKLIEGVKQALLMRGGKCSQIVLSFLRDIRALRKHSTQLFGRHHDIQPFSSPDQVARYCTKADSSLFMFGSHSKKRPNNVVLGRTYEHKVLDMVELGLINYQSIAELAGQTSIPVGTHPFVVFQGDLWESEEDYKKLRNLLHDFFHANQKLRGIDISKTMQILVSFSVTEDKRIFMQVYEVNIKGQDLLEEEGVITMDELGPNAEIVLRRSNWADAELWKKSTHVPKPKKKKEQKNVRFDEIGDKRGKLYVDHQDLNRLPIKKRKLIRKGGLEPKVPKTPYGDPQKKEHEFV